MNPLKISSGYDQQADLVLFEGSCEEHPAGSICWQVGNYVNEGEIVPVKVILIDADDVAQEAQ